MYMIKATPPVPPSRKRPSFRRSYMELFDTLRANHNTWIAVNPGDIAGESSSRKQTVLYLAAKLRRMKIETTHQNGLLYIRSIDVPAEAQNA
jgi:hypothetical protein